MVCYNSSVYFYIVYYVCIMYAMHVCILCSVLTTTTIWVYNIYINNTYYIAMAMGCETYHHLKTVIKNKYGQDACNVGDEGTHTYIEI